MHRLFHRVLLFQFLQILAQAVMDLCRFRQLLSWNAALFCGIGFYEATIDGQIIAPHQSYFHTLPHDLLKQLLEQLRFLKTSMSVLRERRVMRNLLIKTQPGEPAPRHMHAQLFHQLPLARDTVEIADQQQAQQQFGVDGGPTLVAIASLQLPSYEIEVDMTIDQAQQMIFRNLIFEAEVVEQRFRAAVMSHHEQQTSKRSDEEQHR